MKQETKNKRKYYYFNEAAVRYYFIVKYGLTVKQFCKEAGFTRTFFYQEIKRKHFKKENAFACSLAKKLDVKIDWLYLEND